MEIGDWMPLWGLLNTATPAFALRCLRHQNLGGKPKTDLSAKMERVGGAHHWLI
jgi:hypothetical protein